jgi:hypothetical protein
VLVVLNRDAETEKDDDPLLALFNKTERGLDEARISCFVANIIAEARTKGDTEPLKNVFVLAFQTRWCRGGNGELKIFYNLLVVLYERSTTVVVDLVELIPTYSCWKDLLNLLRECKHGNVDYAPLCHKMWNMFARQLKTDKEELAAATHQGRSPKLSLAAKYASSQQAISTVESSKRTRKSIRSCAHTHTYN